MCGPEYGRVWTAALAPSHVRRHRKAALEHHHARPRARSSAGTLAASRRVFRAVSCECAGRSTEGNGLRPTRQVMPAPHDGSTGAPHATPRARPTAGTLATSRKDCGQSLVSVQAGDGRVWPAQAYAPSHATRCGMKAALELRPAHSQKTNCMYRRNTANESAEEQARGLAWWCSSAAFMWHLA